MSLLVTGATGQIGGRVARQLAAAGISQRLLVRDPTRAPDLAGATVVQGSYGNQAAIRAACHGIETVFMVSAAEAVDRRAQHLATVDAIAESGVSRIVYLSFYAAAADSTFTLGRDHWATEQRIRETTLAWTFLQDNLYLDFLPTLVGDDGAIRGPAGAGRLAAVAQADVADVATVVLRNPEAHAGQSYQLTGPESLSLEDLAAMVAAETGRAVRYVPETVPEAYASRAAYGVPDWQLDAWVSTYTAIAAGELDGVTASVEMLTGHAPLSLTDLLRGNASRG